MSEISAFSSVFRTILCLKEICNTIPTLTWHKSVPKLGERQNNPRCAVQPDDNVHYDRLGKGHVPVHWLGDHIVTIVSYGRVRHPSSDARIRTNGGEYLAPGVAQCEAPMEAVVDEDRRLQAHDQIENSQVKHKHIGW